MPVGFSTQQCNHRLEWGLSCWSVLSPWNQSHPYVSLSADIFLVCDEGSGKKSFQIWVNNKDAGFSLAQHQPLPSGVQAITFADIGESIDLGTNYAPMYSLQIETGPSTWYSRHARQCRRRPVSVLAARSILPIINKYLSALLLGRGLSISKEIDSADRPKRFASRIQTLVLTLA